MTDPEVQRIADTVAPSAEDWAEAVRQVRSHYPEDVFPAFSTSTDAKSGTFARHLCDLIQQIAYGVMVDRREIP
jgi:hypothetical protein